MVSQQLTFGIVGRRNGSARVYWVLPVRFAKFVHCNLLLQLFSRVLLALLIKTLFFVDVFITTRVVQQQPQLQYAVELPTWLGVSEPVCGSLLTIDVVVQAVCDRRVLRLPGADTVGVEATKVAAETAARRLPFFEFV